jgi:hypothetical protein
MLPNALLETCWSLHNASGAGVDIAQLLKHQEAAWAKVKETKSCPSPVAAAIDLTQCAEHKAGYDAESGELRPDVFGARAAPVTETLWHTPEVVSHEGRFVHMTVAIASTSVDACVVGFEALQSVGRRRCTSRHPFPHHIPQGLFAVWGLEPWFRKLIKALLHFTTPKHATVRRSFACLVQTRKILSTLKAAFGRRRSSQNKNFPAPVEREKVKRRKVTR